MPCAALPKERVAGNLPKDSPIGLHGIPKETVGSDSEPFVETRPVDSSRWWNQDPLAAALPRERVTNALRIRRREHPATGGRTGFPEGRASGWKMDSPDRKRSVVDTAWESTVPSVPKHRRRGAPEGGCGRLRPSSPPGDPRGDRPAKKNPARHRPWKAPSSAAPRGRARGEASSGPKRSRRGSVQDYSRRCGPRAAPERRNPVGTFGFVSTDLYYVNEGPCRLHRSSPSAATEWPKPPRRPQRGAGRNVLTSKRRDAGNEESRQPSPAGAVVSGPSRRLASRTGGRPRGLPEGWPVGRP
jgi:hypothetical protein